MSDRIVLFVCTGNTCRSPLAEGLLRHALGEDSGISVKSAGIAAGIGEPANPQTLSVLDEVGIDLTNHQAQNANNGLLASAEIIIAMTNNHRQMMLHAFPEAAEKTKLLCDFIAGEEGRDVPDPIGMGRDAYLQTRDVIIDAIPEILAHLGVSTAG